MPSFDFAVALRVPSRCSNSLNSEEPSKSCEQVAFELTSLICCYCDRYAKTRHPVGYHNFGHRLGCYLIRWDRFGPAGDSVNHCDYILLIFGQCRDVCGENVRWPGIFQLVSACAGPPWIAGTLGTPAPICGNLFRCLATQNDETPSLP